MSKKPTISIVVPVYNEAAFLDACLRSIAQQTISPLEVIVVDNNSTDNSIAIAKSYDFVTVLHERRQGVVYARNSGFSAARGDIIGRIDADTLLSREWCETITQLFADAELDAVSGPVQYHDTGLRQFIGFFDEKFRAMTAHLLGKQVYLYGSNMAIRRQVWQEVCGSLCAAKGIHEDLDLAAHCALRGCYSIRYEKRLQASVSSRRIESSLPMFYSYAMDSPRTYKKHGLRTWPMLLLIAILLVVYGPLHFMQRWYDPAKKRLSMRKLLFASMSKRANPAAFID